MCPMCLTTAALIAGGVTSSGGLAAIAIKKFGGKNPVDNQSAPAPSRTKNGAEEIFADANQRRNQDVNDHD
jgi:hypothetical protein